VSKGHDDIAFLLSLKGAPTALPRTPVYVISVGDDDLRNLRDLIPVIPDLIE
jgi:hypothetical protein